MSGRGRRVTIVDVAHAAGCSVATVSRALRGFDNVSPALMARVTEVAGRLGYRPNQIAAQLRSGSTRAVLVIVPMIDQWYYSELMAGAEALLTDEGYDTFVSAVAEAGAMERMLTKMGPRGRVDGVLVAGTTVGPSFRDLLAGMGIPVVAAGASGAGISSVEVDEYRTGFEATSHLLGLGHTRIGVAHWTDQPAQPIAAPSVRLAGYRAALRAAGVEPDPGLAVETDCSIAGGAIAASFVVGHRSPPTALFCTSDLIAIGAIHTLDRLGFEVPRSLSIVGVDDLEMAEITGLTTIRQPVAEIGAIAARLLLDTLSDGAGVQQVTLPAELIERATTAAPDPAW